MVDRTSRRGYRDWFVQRITALLSGIYAVFVIVFCSSTIPFLTLSGTHYLVI